MQTHRLFQLAGFAANISCAENKILLPMPHNWRCRSGNILLRLWWSHPAGCSPLPPLHHCLLPEQWSNEIIRFRAEEGASNGRAFLRLYWHTFNNFDCLQRSNWIVSETNNFEFSSSVLKKNGSAQTVALFLFSKKYIFSRPQNKLL